MIEGWRGVRDNAESARGNGFFDEAIAVRRASARRNEDRSGTDAARVVFNTGNWRVRCACRALRGNFRDEIVPLHAVLDCRGLIARNARQCASREGPWFPLRAPVRGRYRCRPLVLPGPRWLRRR